MTLRALRSLTDYEVDQVVGIVRGDDLRGYPVHDGSWIILDFDEPVGVLEAFDTVQGWFHFIKGPTR